MPPNGFRMPKIIVSIFYSHVAQSAFPRLLAESSESQTLRRHSYVQDNFILHTTFVDWSLQDDFVFSQKL